MRARTKRTKRDDQAKVLVGLFIIAFGVIFFMDRSGMQIADWLISWETILISAGIVTLYKHYFKKISGYVMITVGALFLINEIGSDVIDTKLIVPGLVIVFGLVMIGKATNLFGTQKKKNRHVVFDDDTEISSENFIESTTLFGGVTKNIVSKDFQGAEFTTAFGGTEINLTQADIQQPVTINTKTAFGGVTLIVPSNWEVQVEVTTIFGSVEDKRSMMTSTEVDENKVLTLKGTCVFGGLEIQSYA
ncbi:MAG: LiaF-related protein [Crocinitomicaceae bacterium]|nr:LiaF-related protein [Crocinitomicaceae bacterium]